MNYKGNRKCDISCYFEITTVGDGDAEETNAAISTFSEEIGQFFVGCGIDQRSTQFVIISKMNKSPRIPVWCDIMFRKNAFCTQTAVKKRPKTKKNITGEAEVSVLCFSLTVDN